jgi:hypothetical protein
MVMLNIRTDINRIFGEQTFWKFRRCKKLMELDSLMQKPQKAIQRKMNTIKIVVETHIKELLGFKEPPPQREFFDREW